MTGWFLKEWSQLLHFSFFQFLFKAFIWKEHSSEKTCILHEKNFSLEIKNIDALCRMLEKISRHLKIWTTHVLENCLQHWFFSIHLLFRKNAALPLSLANPTKRLWEWGVRAEWSEVSARAEQELTDRLAAVTMKQLHLRNWTYTFQRSRKLYSCNIVNE